MTTPLNVINDRFIAYLYLDLTGTTDPHGDSRAVRMPVHKGLLDAMANLSSACHLAGANVPDVDLGVLIPDSQFGELDEEWCFDDDEEENDDPVFFDGGYASIGIASMALRCHFEGGQPRLRLVVTDVHDEHLSSGPIWVEDMWAHSNGSDRSRLIDEFLASMKGYALEAAAILGAVRATANNSAFGSQPATEKLRELCLRYPSEAAAFVNAPSAKLGSPTVALMQAVLRENDLNSIEPAAVSAKSKVRL